MATMTMATKNVDRAAREERRLQVEAEQRRLDTVVEGKRNAARAGRLAAERANRVAEAIANGSTVTFMLKDDEMVYRVLVSMAHEDQVARQAARTVVIALAHLLSAIEYEALTAAQVNGVGPNVAQRLALILDGDSGRLCTRFGVVVAEMKKSA